MSASSMPSFNRRSLAVPPLAGGAGVRSLAWRSDALVDVVAGNRVFHLDGRVEASSVFYAYRFDRAVVGPDGWAVVYERLGTKGLLLRHGRPVRELDRSFYCADVTPFPVAFTRRGQQVLLVHAPDAYNRLEIVDAESGTRLTTRAGDGKDFFHSRLAVTPDGRWLLSAGWIWHPFEAIQVLDLERALVEPAHLDGGVAVGPLVASAGGDGHHAGDEDEEYEIDASAAAFDARGRLVFAVAVSGYEHAPRRCCLGVYDPAAQRLVSRTATAGEPGTLMPVGEDHVVVFTDRPRLVRLADGAVVHTFEDLVVDEPRSCIASGPPSVGVPLAVDVAGRRFAVASRDEIAVITFA